MFRIKTLLLNFFINTVQKRALHHRLTTSKNNQIKQIALVVLICIINMSQKIIKYLLNNSKEK